MQTEQLDVHAHSLPVITTQLEGLTQFRDASTGQRLLSWIIDNLLLRYTFAYVLTGWIVNLLYQLFPDYIYGVYYEERKPEMYAIAYGIYSICYLIYYTFCEKAFHGYSLGKLVSGTRAVREDNTELTLGDAFLRSLCRLVPFEAFSGLGTPWHDSWSKTKVIRSR